MREMNKRICQDLKKKKRKKGHFGDNLVILTIVYISGKCVKLITFPECGNCFVVMSENVCS